MLQETATNSTYMSPEKLDKEMWLLKVLKKAKPKGKNEKEEKEKEIEEKKKNASNKNLLHTSMFTRIMDFTLFTNVH